MRTLKPEEEFVRNRKVDFSSQGKLKGIWKVTDTSSTPYPGAQITPPRLKHTKEELYEAFELGGENNSSFKDMPVFKIGEQERKKAFEQWYNERFKIKK